MLSEPCSACVEIANIFSNHATCKLFCSAEALPYEDVLYLSAAKRSAITAQVRLREEKEANAILAN